MIRISAIQDSRVADPAENMARTLRQIDEAAAAGAQVICLQELFTSLYFCQSEDHRHFELAESIPGPVSDQLCDAARRHSVVIVAGLFERRTSGLFHNSAVTIDADGSVASVYRKMHVPDDPYFHEKFYFTPGDLGFRSVATRYGKIGVCICWDQWFPEAARLTAMTGAEILVYPTAIGWLDADRQQYGPSQLNAWQTMMRSHAIANGVFLVAPNRAGREDNIQFWGSSFICDPYGRFLAEAAAEIPDTITAECNLTEVETARTHWPFLRDRRIDAYQGLTRRWLDD